MRPAAPVYTYCTTLVYTLVETNPAAVVSGEIPSTTVRVYSCCIPQCTRIFKHVKNTPRLP